MLIFYQLVIGLIFALLFPFLLLYVLVSGHHRRGLGERLGCYRIAEPEQTPSHRVWIHAASIGEIKAAGIIIEQFRTRAPKSFFILTTMTIHGRDFARSHLGPDICCVLAPLDIPVVTDIVIKRMHGDVYVCLETELWPLLIRKIKKQGTAIVLLNGRLSDRSICRYRRFRFLFSRVLRSFDRIGAISATDKERFLELGADPSRVSITGNVKHDSVLPARPEHIRDHWCNLLSLAQQTHVFVAASTHAPEEQLLISLYERFSSRHGHLWLIAPRHLNRIGEIRQLLHQFKISYDLLSDCKQGKGRCHSLVLVDTFGDLSDLFSIAVSVFIGGSLVECGGHNPMEAAIWEKAVMFGPSMQDFKNGADLLQTGGGGFRVESVEELEQRLRRFVENPAELEAAGVIAGEIARRQQGAAGIQAELIHQALHHANR